ncbi:MAG: TIGR03545 family protein [Bacteriovoracaceae bacterium]|nr:TIGR03545 family protein [Bacteriovoracaceae bacterium]
MNQQLKKQSIVRKGAVIPFTIIVALTVIFNILFLDYFIRKSAEFIGTKINGAEVNVAAVNTSFMNLSFEIVGIEMTDPELPHQNRLQVGRILYKMSWDALLRGKIYIEDGMINDINIRTKRKYPGYVVPEDVSTEPSAAQTSLAAAKEEFKGNIFGDISSVLTGVDAKSQTAQIGNELKSKKRYEELNKEVAGKEEQWKAIMKDLPKDDEISSIKKRIKAIDFGNLKDFKKAKDTLKEIDSVKDDIKKVSKSYESASKQLKTDVNYIETSIKDVEKLVKEDVQDLKKRLNIPSLDPQSMAKILFGAEFANKIKEVEHYASIAKEYMPPKKDKTKTKDTISTPPPRGKGVNYQFGTPTSYPLFWAKHLQIDSSNAQGNLKGQILDLTSDQATINKATKINIEGNLPPENINGMMANIVFDHRNGAKDSVFVRIASMGITDKNLSNSEDVKFAVKNAIAFLEFKANLIDGRVGITLQNILKEVNYSIEAKSKTIQEILESVAASTQTISVNAEAKGSWSDLDWSLRTNLAESLKNGVGAHADKKIKELQDKLENEVKSKIEGEKSKLLSKVDSLKGDYLGKLDLDKNKSNDLLKELADGQSNSSKSAAKKAGAKQLDKLKKKLKL